jgi:hypothetical protein
MPRVTPGARFYKSPHCPAIALLLAALAFAVYIGNGHMHGNGDTVPASLVAVVLLTDGSLRLDRFTEVSGPVPYFVVRTPRGVASLFPVATGILAAPFMMPAILAPTAPARAWIEAAHRQEKYAAALITAASVAVFVLLCWQLGFNDWLTIGLTLFLVEDWWWLWRLPAAFAVTLAFAAMSYRFFERPFLRLKARYTYVTSEPARLPSPEGHSL